MEVDSHSLIGKTVDEISFLPSYSIELAHILFFFFLRSDFEKDGGLIEVMVEEIRLSLRYPFP